MSCAKLELLSQTVEQSSCRTGFCGIVVFISLQLTLESLCGACMTDLDKSGLALLMGLQSLSLLLGAN